MQYNTGQSSKFKIAICYACAIIANYGARADAKMDTNLAGTRLLRVHDRAARHVHLKRRNVGASCRVRVSESISENECSYDHGEPSSEAEDRRQLDSSGAAQVRGIG